MAGEVACCSLLVLVSCLRVLVRCVNRNVVNEYDLADWKSSLLSVACLMPQKTMAECLISHNTQSFLLTVATARALFKRHIDICGLTYESTSGYQSQLSNE